MFDWVLSDTHFEHTNINELANRPFNSTDEMDQYLLDRWNQRIEPGESVLFLGDLAIARPENVSELFAQLNGNITFIKGNHDDKGISKTLDIPVFSSVEFEYKGLTLYCSHYPPEDNYEPPEHTQYWLCGHSHNNRPFFDPHQKLFNFSVDVIGFEPLPFSDVMDLLLRQKSRKIETYTEHKTKSLQEWRAEQK